MLTELMGSEYQGAAPLDNRYFMPMGTWEAAKHGFEGTLTVPEFVMLNPEENNSADSWDYFPGFTVDFFSDGKSLVPVSREIALKLGDRSYWRIMISPGTVWFEREDGGMSRASFPFTLVNGLFNDVHNGLATFVYDETRVSSLFLQVTQETSPVYKADFWGVTTMRYTPHPLENKNYLAARFAEEDRRQIPVLPFSALGKNVDARLLETFDGGIEHEEISATSLIWNDRLYLQPCTTRHGDYPWGPGEIARYSSINTFILSAAMDGFLKSKEGPDADIWEMVLSEVYRPIGIFHAPIMRTIQSDKSPGLPIFG